MLLRVVLRACPDAMLLSPANIGRRLLVAAAPAPAPPSNPAVLIDPGDGGINAKPPGMMGADSALYIISNTLEKYNHQLIYFITHHQIITPHLH